MSDMVSRMVDLLFQDVVENEETKALHEELMINCQEHFADLTENGMSEDEALQAVMESLSGMQEVIDQYPKKPAEAREKSSAEPEKPAGQRRDPAEDSTERRFTAEGLSRIRVDAGAHDVRVERTAGSEVLVRCAKPENLNVFVEGNTLNIQTVRLTEEAAAVGEEFAEKGRRVMDMSLNELLGKVRNVLDSAFRNVADRINTATFGDETPIEVLLPEELAAALEVNASSGDIRAAAGKATEISLRTASGDVELDCSVREELKRLFVSSASGDITVRSAFAGEGEISAISGDVELEGDFGTLACKSVSGDVSFEGTAVELRSKSVSGDVEITLSQADSGTITAESTSGDVDIRLPENSGSVHVSMKTTIGEVDSNVEDAGEAAALRLSVRTVSGDLTVRKG